MKKSLLLCAALLAAGSMQAQANPNIIRSAAMIKLSENDDQFWRTIDAYAGDWENVRAEYGCSVWTPDESTQTVGTAFLQRQVCSQDQQREVQQRQQNEKTQVIRNVGNAHTENRTQASDHSRQAIGALETWVAASPAYGDWANTSALYSCSNWSPESSVYTATANFTQRASDCSLNQQRPVQPREQESTTGEYRNVGAASTQSQVLGGQVATRNYSVNVSEWVNKGDVANCSNWSPDPSTVATGTSFTQNATSCTQSQERTRVEQYDDHATGERVTAVNVTQTKSVAASSSRTSTGTMITEVCRYDSVNRWAITYKPAKQNGGADFTLTVTWDGGTVYSSFTPNQPPSTTSFVKNGYTYTRGTMVSGGTLYYVCRK